MNKFELLKKDKKEIFDTFIFPNITRGVRMSENPQAHILGGQPAAGKSHFVKKVLENNKDMVVINGDDFRGYHPNYYYLLKNQEEHAADLTQNDVNYWIEKAILKAAEEKYSMVVEGTMRNVDVPIKTAKLLKDFGYSVVLNIITINPKISKIDIEKRFLVQKKDFKLARFTKTDAHDNVVANIFKNILRVSQNSNFDYVKVFRREVDDYILLFERKKIKDFNIEKLKNILENEKERKLSQKEKEYIETSKKFISNHS